MTLRWAAFSAAIALTACGSAAAPTQSLTVDASRDPTLALSDTATLTAGDAAVEITATLTCVTGYTAFGSVAVTAGTAPDPSQPQGYSGLLRLPCQGQPQELQLTLTSKGAPFHEGPALGRAAFTLNLCDPACRWVSVSKNITVVHAAD